MTRPLMIFFDKETRSHTIMIELLSLGLLLLTIAIGWLEASTSLSTRTITEKQGRDVVLSCRFEQLSDKDRVMWSKDGVVLSVNQEISGDKQKYEIIGKYDLIIKTIAGNDTGRYLCQNFDQALSMTIVLTVLSKFKIELRSCNNLDPTHTHVFRGSDEI